jgi:hypothetical protein
VPEPFPLVQPRRIAERALGRVQLGIDRRELFRVALRVRRRPRQRACACAFPAGRRPPEPTK